MRGEMMLKYWEILEKKLESKDICKNNMGRNGDIEIGLDYVRVLYKLLRLSLNTEISVSLSG
jgi:hypothetical protein